MVDRNPMDIVILDNSSPKWRAKSEKLLDFMSGRGLVAGKDYMLLDGTSCCKDALPEGAVGNKFPVLQIREGNAYGFPYIVASGSRALSFLEVNAEALGI